MKTFANLFVSLILAFWIVVIAVLSVQNAQPVSLRFLSFESIQISVGLVLAFSASFGIVGMSLLQPLWGISGSRNSGATTDDDAEFFVDEEE